MKKKFKIKSISLTIFMVMFIIALIIAIIVVKPFSKAEEETSTSSKFSGGTGTEEDPYLIGTAQDLIDLATYINSSDVTKRQDDNGLLYKKAYYKLINDISFRGIDSSPMIGYTENNTLENVTTNYSFQGNFNGDGHTISDLTYTITDVPSGAGNYGLFGILWGDGENNAKVYNLVIDGMSINVKMGSKRWVEVKVGTIAGHLGQNASIKNCIVKNSVINVTSDYSVKQNTKLSIGGIVGETSGNASNAESAWTMFDDNDDYGLENCFSNVNIIVDDSNWENQEASDWYCRYAIGGVMGGICQAPKLPKNCVYTGIIKATKAFIGPIMGRGELTPNANRAYYSQLFAIVDKNNSRKDDELNANKNYFYEAYMYNEKYSNELIDFKSLYGDENKKISLGDINVYSLSPKDSSTMMYVQGVNIGVPKENLTDICNIMNSYSGINDIYKEWNYNENGQVDFSKKEILKVFSGGLGTEADPYILETVEDLQNLAKKVNNYEKDSNGGYYKTKYYKLNKDINFYGKTWTPIGFYDSDDLTDCTIKYSFQGKFDGNGHTISNITYETNFPQKRGTYGLFGMLWGDIFGYAEVYNLVVDNMNIILNDNGSLSKGTTIGVIAGHLGKDSSIRNCIVKNSSIKLGSDMGLIWKTKLNIGGIVGETSGNAANDSSGWSDFNISSKYGIENCFSNVDIITDSNWWNDPTGIYDSQYAIGGIVGSLVHANKFPENCIYEGNIKTKTAFAGPIFGKGEFITGTVQRTDYDKLFAGIGSKDKSDKNYYYKTTFENPALQSTKYLLDENFKTEERKRTIEYTEDSINYSIDVYTISSDQTLMASVQGINRGKLITNLQDNLAIMNSYSGIGKKYKKWYYDLSNDSLSFDGKMEFLINNDGYNFYVNIINSEYEESSLKYKWYVDDIIQENENSKTISLQPLLFKDRVLKCDIYAGNTLIGTTTKIVNGEEINIEIVQNQENNKIIYAEIESSDNIKNEDFEYQWYYKDSESDEYSILNGENTYQLDTTNMSYGMVLKLVVTSKKYKEFTKEILYTKSNVIYVSQEDGSDENDGTTEQNAVKTLEKAYELLPNENDAQNNIIVIMGNYTANLTMGVKKANSKVFIKPATLTGKYLNRNYSSSLKVVNHTFFNDNTIIKDIELTSDGAVFIYAQENDLELKESVTFSERLNMTELQAGYWGVTDISNYRQLKQVTLVGGTLNYKQSTHDEIKTKTSNIIVECSGIAVIVGGARTQGDAEVYGTIDRHASVKIDINIPESDSKIDVGAIVGGQCDSSCYINSELNINSGKIGRIVGGTLGYGNIYSTNIPRDTFYGSTQINVNGGIIDEIFGGSLGRNEGTSYMYGQVELNINDGIIKSNVYGAGAGGTMGYSQNSSDTFKDDEIYGVLDKTMTKTNESGEIETYELDKSKVTLNITGGTINGSVYGGGYGKSSYLTADKISDDGGTLYGDTYINVTGGIIKGDIYGGGKGTSYYGTAKNSLAQIYGNVVMNISENANIEGNVYGGSEGISDDTQYANVAKITGDIILNITGENVKISGENVFGGGNAGKVDGTVSLNLKDVNLSNNIYGGGNGENATIENSKYYQGNKTSTVENKVIEISIKNSYIDGDIYGGGNAGKVSGSIILTVTDKSNVTQAVYGGGNKAQVGEEGNEANIYVYIHNAIIGNEDTNNKISENGEVFGGGNLGVVYGNTDIEIGDTDDKISTVVGKQVYAGGRGNSGQITVYGNSIGRIIGTNTTIAQYGSSELGEVNGNVDIYFDTYKKTNNSDRYKMMEGINKATTIIFKDSYVYLTTGLDNIKNLNVPQNSGLMISEDSILEGNLSGGGELNIQSGAVLVIKGELDNTKTTLVLVPKQDENGRYQILGGDNNPYVVVLGNDNSDIDSNKKTGMISGETRKYTINNNMAKDYTLNSTTYKASIYYIDSTIAMSNGVVENIYNIRDKIYNTNINNTEKVYILDNNAITSQMQIDYTMIRQRNNNSEWEFTDNTSMKNVKRYLYLTGEDSVTSLPTNTVITMITNGEYYRYVIPEGFGTEEYWDSINEIIGVTENLENEIPLSVFKNNQGQYYQEENNIQEKINLNDTSLVTTLSTSENYRFIIDFSNCNNISERNKLAGNHEVMLDIIDYKQNGSDIVGDKIYTETENSNEIRIESRNFKLITTNAHKVDTQIEKMKFDIQFIADEISNMNICEEGQGMKLVISLLDADHNKIEIPHGVQANIDGTNYNIINDEIIYNIIDLMDTVNYDKNIELQFDMRNVEDDELLKDGKYYLKIEAYMSEDDLLLGNSAVTSSETEIAFKQVNGYGIKLILNSNNNEKQPQIIFDNESVSKKINIKFIKGTLEDGAYINVKTFRKNNGFKYNELNTTMAEAQKITDLKENGNESIINFDKSINNGVYRMVYQLCDKYGNVLTEDFINFILKRN